MRTHRWFWVVPLLLIVTFFIARKLDANAIWVDEYWTIYTAGGAYYGPLTPADIIQRIITEDPWNTPGHYFLLNGWALFVGWSPFAGRTLSLMLSLLAVAWTYRLGRDVGGHHAGLGAAVALGTSAFFIHYGGELRSYAALPVLGAFCTWLYWHITHRAKTSVIVQIAFALCIGVMPYVHYFAVLPALAIALYHLLFTPKNRTWWRVPILMAIGALLFTPWLIGVTVPVLSRIVTEGHESPHLSLSDMPTTLLAFANGSITLLVIVGWYILHNFNGWTRRSTNDIRLSLQERLSPPLHRMERGLGGEIIFALFTSLTALLIAFLINEWRPILLYYRYLIAVFPLLALVVGLAIARTSRPIILYSAWAITGIAAILSPTFMDTYHNPLINAQPWHRIVPALEARMQPGDAAAFHMPDEVWYVWQKFSADYYLYAMPLSYQIFDSFRGVPDENYFQRANSFIVENIAPRFWNVYQPENRPDGLSEFERALALNYATCDTPYYAADYRLELYAHIDEPPALLFDDAIGVHLVTPLPANANDTLEAVVSISISENVPIETYSVALHVMDSEGNLVAQGEDFGLPLPPFACRYVPISLDGLAPGTYTLQALIYTWQTNERLSGTVIATGETGDSLPLGTFTIAN